MKKETWKDIKGYEGYYQVSNQGRVKSLERKVWSSRGFHLNLREKLLTQSTDSGGYTNVSLSKNGNHKTFKVHKLVAIAFLNHTPSRYKIVVDHIDNNKLNNNLNNLQLTSARINVSKDRNGGTSEYTGVSWCSNRKRWVAKIMIKGRSKFLGSSVYEIEASQMYFRELERLEL